MLNAKFRNDWTTKTDFVNYRGFARFECRISFGRISRHYCDAIMSPMASQITSLTIVYSIVYSRTDQRKHQSSASLAFVRGIHRRPVNSPHKGPVTRKMIPFDDVCMLPHDFSVECPTGVRGPRCFKAYNCHRRNGRYLADDILEWNVLIWIQMSSYKGSDCQ